MNIFVFDQLNIDWIKIFFFAEIHFRVIIIIYISETFQPNQNRRTFPSSRRKKKKKKEKGKRTCFSTSMVHSQLSNLFIQAGTKKAAFSSQYFTITEFLEGKWGNGVAAINSIGGRRRQRGSGRWLRSTAPFPWS